MTIIRALWGQFDIFKNEIPKTPLFADYNETVFVWGQNNVNQLKKMGYKTIMVDENALFNEEEKFIHKLDALELAYQIDKEILFLDWDVKILSEINHSILSELNSPCMPLYSYPKSYHRDYLKSDNNFISQLDRYSWHYNDTFIIPNASFIYFKDFSLGLELKKLNNQHRFHTLIEEFSFKVFVDCPLDDYINKFCPPIIYGRPDYQVFPVNGDYVSTAEKLNRYIDSKIKTNILLEHY